MQWLGCSGDVMHMGRGGIDRVDQAGVFIYTDKHLHTVGAAPRSGNTTGCLF